MFNQRLSRLQAEMRARQIDCVALIPGANLRYLTGLDFHLMERATIGFFPAEGQPTLVLPALEVARFETDRPYEADVVSYGDSGDPADAVRQAVRALPEIQRIAVEHLRMRVHELRLVQRCTPNAFMEDAGPVMERLRITKSADEVAALRQAIAITEGALQAVIESLQAGLTERQIAARLNVAQLERGGEVVPFAPIVQVGPSAALPHGTPGDRPLTPGQVLLCDFGTTSGGYISDLTRTFFVGSEPDSRARDIYEAVKEANAAGRAAAGPGVPCSEVDRAARQVIERAGFGPNFIHGVGHGLGLDAHEGPYMRDWNHTPLEPGMTFTVEPGIYLPGEIGVRIEDDVVITADGAETLTTFDRELRVVEV